jgi:hypothetical protein
MALRAKRRIHPAFKHGAYSAAGILPGENAAEFEKLHRDVIAELIPNGVIEHDIVASLARLLWRKQNLETLRVAELAKKRCEQITAEHVPQPLLMPSLEVQWRERTAEGHRIAEARAREELGDVYALVDNADVTTTNGLRKELAVLGALDGMIEKCLKRLLFLRGLKSISASVSSSAPSVSIAGPERADNDES